MNYRKSELLMGILLLVFVYLISGQAGMIVSAQKVMAGKKKPVVVVDVGHGGNDPGKIGVDGSLEKDINLSIARKLKAYLEASDVEVVMTRQKDEGLYRSTDRNKKVADMRARCALIDKAKPDLVISIHQKIGRASCRERV